jgi:hypothetical protein
MQDKDAFKVFSDKDSKPIWHVREYSTDDITSWFMAGFLKAITKGDPPSAAFEKAIRFEQKHMK